MEFRNYLVMYINEREIEMKLQKLYSLTRQAVKNYDMIRAGDCIAIGVSGGKDSFTLLYALAGLRKFYPEPFSLKAITVDLGYPEFDPKKIAGLCEELGVEYHIVRTRIKDMLPADSTPCSLCARLRKGALNEKALEIGCNKIAYGHHMDDAVETMMLSLIYEGSFHSFEPVTHLERTGLTLIRPMIYIPEKDIIGFRNKMDLPVTGTGCPFEPETERAYVKSLLRDLDHHAPGVRKRMLTAIRAVW